jgi:protein TonB
MKKIYFIIFLFILSNTSWSQKAIVISNEEEENTVPFAIIEDVPVFPGCEEIEKKEGMKCFENKLREHIVANFRYPKKALKEKIEGRVNVHYIINEEGLVEDIQTKGGNPILQTEALRIIRLIPKMEPGKFRGKPIKCKHVIPITFKLQ